MGFVKNLSKIKFSEHYNIIYRTYNNNKEHRIIKIDSVKVIIKTLRCVSGLGGYTKEMFNINFY